MRLRAGVTMLLTAALPAAAVAGGVAETYADAAARILGAETVQGQARPLLRHLTDRVGPRLSGSAGAEAAVRWAAGRLKAEGLEVRVEPVMVPHVTALGGSDPTPEAGLTAEVVEAAHLDSCDLGTGAIDDGTGVAMVMESLRLLKSLGLRPRRTIRGVLFMNEENGLRGGKGYWHHTAADALDKVDPQELAQGAAALAVMAYVLADMPEALPHPAPPGPVRP